MDMQDQDGGGHQPAGFEELGDIFMANHSINRHCIRRMSLCNASLVVNVCPCSAAVQEAKEATMASQELRSIPTWQRESPKSAFRNDPRV